MYMSRGIVFDARIASRRRTRSVSRCAGSRPSFKENDRRSARHTGEDGAVVHGGRSGGGGTRAGRPRWARPRTRTRDAHGEQPRDQRRRLLGLLARSTTSACWVPSVIGHQWRSQPDAHGASPGWRTAEHLIQAWKAIASPRANNCNGTEDAGHAPRRCPMRTSGMPGPSASAFLESLNRGETPCRIRTCRGA